METILGVLLLITGVPAAIWPYKFARVNEQIDAIGSKRPAYAVEPADWNVRLTRIVGIVLVIAGAWLLIIS